MQQQLSITNEKLVARKVELQEKRERREKVRNRKREELNNPILPEHYDLLMHKIGFKQTFFKFLRLALTVLFLTGMRISEIRNIRLQDLKFLFTSERPHIKFQTAKKAAPRTAFLTPIEKELIKERKKDFEFIFQWQDENYLTPIFGNSKTFELCGREHTNKTINKEI